MYRARIRLVVGLLLACAVSWIDAVAPAKASQAAGNPLGLFADHGSLGVADLDGMTEWYQRVLGFEAAPRKPGAKYDVQRLSIPGYFLNLLRQNGSVRLSTDLMDTDKQGIISITFGTRDAEAAYQRLVANKVKVIRLSKDERGKVSSVHFMDPEGNHLEISQR